MSRLSVFALLSTTKIASGMRLRLFEAPVSNNGARARYIIHSKEDTSGLESQVEIVNPAELGGLKSEEYLKFNPQGKMPLLLMGEEEPTAIFEADAIARFLLSSFRESSPTFYLDDAILNAKSDMLVRLHDCYIQPMQWCMYKASLPFGAFGGRSAAMQELRKQLQILSDTAERNRVGDGPYILGTDGPTLADATIMPTLAFTSFMLPRHWGWTESEAFGQAQGATGPAYLESVWKNVKNHDAHAARVIDEILGAVGAWEASGRWKTIHGATSGEFSDQDSENDTVFGKILRGEISTPKIHEDDFSISFPDINPAAPRHFLVIPKSRNSLRRLTDATEEHVDVLGRMLLAAVEAHQSLNSAEGSPSEEFDGLRLVINDGPVGGQEVPHLHFHVLSGRKLTWPPG